MQTQIVNKNSKNLGRQMPRAESDIARMLRDEDAFLKRAGAREYTQAVLYFRAMASKATTPQARDFYLDRANQFSLRAVQSGGFGRMRVSA